MDLETLLGLAGAVLFPLAVVVLVLWPILVAVIESSKVIRGSVRPSTSFVITDTGATIWQKDSRNSTTDSIRVGDKRLRLSVLFACGMEAAFILFLTVFLFQHAEPHGDGMEMGLCWFCFYAGLSAFHLARVHPRTQWKVACSCRWPRGSRGVAYFGLWPELVSELGLPKA